MNQRPVSTTLPEDKIKPKCGVANVRKVCILSLYLNIILLYCYFSRCGSAALINNPPKECPTNEIFVKLSLGHQSLIHRLTSSASL